MADGEEEEREREKLTLGREREREVDIRRETGGWKGHTTHLCQQLEAGVGGDGQFCHYLTANAGPANGQINPPFSQTCQTSPLPLLIVWVWESVE